VNSEQRLYVDGVERNHSADAAIKGDAYNINTGVITLTSANKSAVLYLKNNAAENLYIDTLFYLIGNSTGISTHSFTLLVILRVVVEIC
jgi:hypothetical protein